MGWMCGCMQEIGLDWMDGMIRMVACTRSDGMDEVDGRNRAQGNQIGLLPHTVSESFTAISGTPLSFNGD